MAGYIGKRDPRVYRSIRWKRLRLAIKDRDGWRCRKCGKAGRLEVHHIRPVAQDGDPYDPENLRTLCRDCHFNAHRPENRAAGRAAMRPDRRAWASVVDELTKG